MKKILLLGAGRSTAALIDYLLLHAPGQHWQIAIADVSVAHLAWSVTQNPLVRSFALDVLDETRRDEEIAKVDVVISMLPALFHPVVAQSCLDLGKHLVTASYVPLEIKAMDTEAQMKGLTFLMECGLDPGIDHMSAIQIIHHIQAQGGTITSFKSFTGGLLAPESDNNPWHYKFTWKGRSPAGLAL